MEKSVWNSEYVGDELLWGKMHFSKKGLLAFIFESEINNVPDNHSIYTEWVYHWTQVSCIVGRFFTSWAMREACLPFSSCYNFFSLS